MAALARLVPRSQLGQLRLIVSPRTLLRWQCPPYPAALDLSAPCSRAAWDREASAALVLEMARDNPGWGYRRTHGELAGLGYKLAPSTVWQILKDVGIDPVKEVLRPHTDRMRAVRIRTVRSPGTSRPPGADAGRSVGKVTAGVLLVWWARHSPQRDGRCSGPR